MWALETIAVAFGLYSVLPVPQFVWKEKNTRYALAAFPLVGVALGLVWQAACALSAALALPDILRGALLCVLPTLVTGGIHLDGYADTSDALASHAAPERKQAILRDPHIGSFAVLRLCVYFVLYFALCASVEPTGAMARNVRLSFVLSRALSGTLLTRLPVAQGSNMVKAFADVADKQWIRAILTFVCAVCLVGFYCYGGWMVFFAATLVSAAVTVRYVRLATRDFGGTSGDLAGWFLVKLEFWLLAVLWILQRWG